MNFLPLLMFAVLVASAPLAAATSPDYDLLIVACDESSCRRVAEEKLAGVSGNMTEYRHDGLRLQIETIARRLDAVDARISLDVRPTDANASVLRSGVRNLSQRVQVYVEPCILKQGAFSSVAAFVSAGIIYRVWARLATVP